MRNYLAKYSPREQLIIGAIAAMLLLFCGYFFVVEPLGNYSKRASDDLANNQEILAYVEQAAKRATNLRNSGSAYQNPQSSAAVLVERVLKQFELGTPNSLTPNGNNKASLNYTEVEFDRFMQAVDTLATRYGLQLSELKVRGQQEGQVVLSAQFARQ